MTENPADIMRRAAKLMRDSAAVMRPGVGKASAELFDAAASAYESGEPWWADPLALARALLGKPEE